MPHDELTTNNTTVGVWCLALHLVLLLLLLFAHTTNRLLAGGRTLIIVIRAVFLLELNVGLLTLGIVVENGLAACVLMDDNFITGLGTGGPKSASQIQ